MKDKRFGSMWLVIFLAVSALIQGCSSEEVSTTNAREAVSAYWQTTANEPVVVDLIGENHSIQMNEDFHVVKYKSTDSDGKTVNVDALDFDEVWKLTLQKDQQGNDQLHMFIREGVEGELSYVMSLTELEKQMAQREEERRQISLDDLKLDFQQMDGVKVQITTSGQFLAGDLYLQNNSEDVNIVNTEISLLSRDERKALLQNCSDVMKVCKLTIHGTVSAEDDLVMLEKIEFASQKQETEEAKEKPEPVGPVTIKDFQLGQSTADVMTLINKLGKQKDSGWNNCSGNTGSVKPFVEGLAPIDSHLYDQACIVWAYDLIGSLVDVTAIFHSGKLIWAEFNSRGGKSPSSNQALTQALERKYGKAKSFKYADLFGAETAKKWQVGDALIKLKSSTLILESVKGREAMKARENSKNTKAGAVL